MVVLFHLQDHGLQGLLHVGQIRLARLRFVGLGEARLTRFHVELQRQHRVVQLMQARAELLVQDRRMPCQHILAVPDLAGELLGVLSLILLCDRETLRDVLAALLQALDVGLQLGQLGLHARLVALTAHILLDGIQPGDDLAELDLDLGDFVRHNRQVPLDGVALLLHGIELAMDIVGISHKARHLLVLAVQGPHDARKHSA
mmetsp:Transcript_100879/g.290007  ORF Transcript_100879/g.290007 Transcript_100879/m.290007 type:complete len:202 (-) Transcript_100879:209-814(-)